MDSIENSSGFTPEQTQFLLTLFATATAPVTWVDEVGAGRYLGVSRRMLQDYRHNGTGPVWHKAGGRLCRYRIADLDAFMVAQTGAVE